MLVTENPESAKIKIIYGADGNVNSLIRVTPILLFDSMESSVIGPDWDWCLTQVIKNPILVQVAWNPTAFCNWVGSIQVSSTYGMKRRERKENLKWLKINEALRFHLKGKKYFPLLPFRFSIWTECIDNSNKLKVGRIWRKVWIPFQSNGEQLDQKNKPKKAFSFPFNNWYFS